MAWPSSAAVPVQCDESCWSEARYDLWNCGVSDIGRRSGAFGLGSVMA